MFSGRFLGSTSLILFLVSASWVHAGLNIVLTNDDGWSSEGIQANKRALEEAGHIVTLVAPLDGQSGSSAALEFPPVSAKLERREGTTREFSLARADGSSGAEPATSALVGIGIATELHGARPDLLVSGTNAGANLSSATQFSGTVGAVIASIADGFNGQIPAIAISTNPVCLPECTNPVCLPGEGGSPADCDARNRVHYENVALFLVRVIERLEDKRGRLGLFDELLPGGVALSINVPPLPPSKILGVKLARQGRVAGVGPAAVSVSVGCLDGCANLEVGESGLAGMMAMEPARSIGNRDSDVSLFDRGYITIVPIESDYTARASRRWLLRSLPRGLMAD